MLFAEVIASLVVLALPQAPGVPIPDQSSAGLEREERRLSAQMKPIVAAEKLLSIEQIQAQLAKPVTRELTLPKPRSKALSASDVAAIARAAHWRVGWCFLCTHCDNWHTDLACGYAISEDGAIATCAHVLEKPAVEMKSGTLIAVNQDGKVFPVTAVLANNPRMDAGIVKIDAKLQPLAFDEFVRPGDRAFCFSRPLDQRGYFSAGMVNRFYWDAKPANDAGAVAAVESLRVNVSTPWAPGSSGAAVLNERGNVIAHVAEIVAMNELGSVDSDEELARKATVRDVEDAVPLITLHIGIPARSVAVLANVKH